MKITIELAERHQERFFEKVEIGLKLRPGMTTECWLWTGIQRGNNRYGGFNSGTPGKGGVAAIAHRMSWVIHFGEIPENMEVCHECDTPTCIRPDHLFLGTHADNMRDMVRKGRQGPRRPLVGERCNLNRFSVSQVMEIRNLYESGMLQKDIAKKFMTHQTTISGIVRCANWKHLGLPSLSKSRMPSPDKSNAL